MYQSIQDVQLKNGETVQLGVVSGPDDSEFGKRLLRLLGHKGPVWQWQIEQSLKNSHPGVESRFYVLSKLDQPFANIMAVESRGIGIFGHVYTAPEERRKGAADAIHAFQIEDFKRRGGRALYLGTTYDTHPWRLYKKHGFESAEAHSGYMYWFAAGQDAFEREVLAPGPVRREALAFKHWPLLPALSMSRHAARVRVAGMDVLGPRSTEGGALHFLAATDPQATEKLKERERNARAFVSVSEKSQVPIALASLMPAPTFWEQADLVDLFCAPGLESELPELFKMLQVEAGRSAICYADTRWPAKKDILRSCGFNLATTLKNHAYSPDGPIDVELWAK